MKVLLLLLLALPALAAPKDDDKDKMTVEKSLLAPMTSPWLKVYPLSPFKANWSFDADIKDIDKGLPKLLKAFEKAGAHLTQPLEYFPSSRHEKSQQLSFRASFKGAQACEKYLRKNAQVTRAWQRPTNELVSLAEVNDKIERLAAERKAYETQLSSMPAVSSLVEELLGHLLSVKAIQERTDSEVLINLMLKESR